MRLSKILLSTSMFIVMISAIPMQNPAENPAESSTINEVADSETNTPVMAPRRNKKLEKLILKKQRKKAGGANDADTTGSVAKPTETSTISETTSGTSETVKGKGKGKGKETKKGSVCPIYCYPIHLD